jgi:hypothetical protein
MITNSQPKKTILAMVLWGFVGYGIISCLTFPFIDRVWLGEIPLLALIQLPKIAVAGWLRSHVIIKLLPFLGFSQVGYSEDFFVARPYALAVVYLIPMLVIGTIVLRRRDEKLRRAAIWFFVAGVVDYAFTLWFAKARYLTVY